MSDLRQNEVFCFQYSRTFDRFVDREMLWKFFLEEIEGTVEYQCGQPTDRFRGSGRQTAHVACVGECASEPIPEARNVSMLDGEWKNRQIADPDAVERFNDDELEMFEMRIILGETRGRFAIRENWQLSRKTLIFRPAIQEGEPAGRVRVDMREQHGVDFLWLCVDELLENVRPGVDQDRGRARRDQRGRPASPAFAPFTPRIDAGGVRVSGARDRGRRAGPEKAKDHADIVSERSLDVFPRLG